MNQLNRIKNINDKIRSRIVPAVHTVNVPIDVGDNKESEKEKALKKYGEENNIDIENTEDHFIIIYDATEELMNETLKKRLINGSQKQT